MQMFGGCFSRQVLETVLCSTLLKSALPLFGLWKLFAFYSRTTCQIKLDEENRKLYS